MRHSLFSCFGIELEYMVVDRDSIAVRPIVDTLLRDVAALPGAVVESESEPGWPDELSLGDISLGNELAAHVIELKVSRPAPSLRGLGHDFHAAVTALAPILENHYAMLLPGGMHPTMDPMREMTLWPHGNKEVYQAFNRIFDCRGHGWANLQACHINLPFADADSPTGEFARLHAAIRALLPIMPALSAASPLMDARPTGVLDNRLEVYRTNSARIPAATGKVIPEPVYTRADYDREIFQKIYAAYAPHDPEGLLRDEWANSRGCIARFSRDAIEIRVLDVQECPRCDLAIAQAIVSVLRAICDGIGFERAAIAALEVDPMHDILLSVIRGADRAVLRDATYLQALGMPAAPCSAGDVWRHLLERCAGNDPGASTWRPIVDHILTAGPLARRILRALGNDASPNAIATVYRRLAGCLASNAPFVP